MPDKAKIETDIDLLAALERGEVVTQLSLAKRIAVSVGLTNALLKRAVQKGYVKAKAAPYKRYAYYLTPRGFSEKSRLVAEYLEISLDFFRNARQEYADIFARARSSGMRRIVLVGSGELAEIAMLAAYGSGIEIAAVVDRETNADTLNGVPVVRRLEDIPDVDAAVITASRQPQAAFDAARTHFDASRLMAPRLLRISPRAADEADGQTRGRK